MQSCEAGGLAEVAVRSRQFRAQESSRDYKLSAKVSRGEEDRFRGLRAPSWVCILTIEESDPTALVCGPVKTG
jgi:hypothetical protein